MSEQNESQVDIVLDDVEAHGLREVAAAAGIGAAVIGAGGAALAATSVGGPGGPGSGVRPPAVVNQTVQAADHLGTQVTGGATGLAASTGGAATGFAKDTTAAVTTFAAPETGLATRTTSEAVHAAAAVKQAATQAAIRTVHHTAAPVADRAKATTEAATKSAEHAASAATHDATSVEKTSIAVVRSTVDQVSQGYTLDLSVMRLHASTAAAAAPIEGTVSVTDSRGITIATATVTGGAATVHLRALGADESLTVHFTPRAGLGLGPSMTAWTA